MTKEEAINIYQRLINPRIKEAFEFFAPELRESEDERIRKELLGYHKRMAEKFTEDENCRHPVWIAWLEKQKDSKWSPSRDEMGVLYKLCYLSNQITDEDDTKLTRLYQDLKREYFNGHSFENMFPSEKQKEQKPAEWSDTDNIGWDEAFACVTRAEKSAKNEEELQNAVTAEKWLKEIKFKYYVHPVNQEWSDEDEKMRDRVIDIFNRTFSV